MDVTRRLLSSSILASCLAIASCGGGGGGSGGPNPGGGTPPPNSNTNAAPTITTTSFAATEDQDFTGQLSATDANGDSVTFANTSAPSRGTLVSFTPTGAFVYRPNADAFGSDSFAVSVSDGRGGTSSATVALSIAGANDAVLANHDRVQVASSATLDVPVLANDVDPDNDVTLTIVEPALVGTATVSSNNSVSIASLPVNFRGLTRFRYRITDSVGGASEAYANVFVDTPPFRAVLGLSIDNRLRIGITDFTGEPRLLNSSDPITHDTKTFRPSRNGEVVAYHRENAGATSDIAQICSVRTTSGALPQCFQIPDERQIAMVGGNPVYTVSADGRWIAAVLMRKDSSVVPSLYLIDTNAPSVGRLIPFTDPLSALLPTFSSDSQFLYFIVNDVLPTSPSNATFGLGIYRVPLGISDTPIRMTVAEDPGSRVEGLRVSHDGARILFQRRGTNEGVWFVEAATPGVEHRLSHVLTLDEQLQSANGRAAFSNRTGTTMAYVVWRGNGTKDLYMTNVSATAPNPHLVHTVPATMPSGIFPIVHPSGEAILFNTYTNTTNSDMLYEQSTDPSIALATVAAGTWGTYDSTGNNIVLGTNVYVAPTTTSNIKVVTRSTFGSPQTAGTPGLETIFTDNMGESSRGAILAAESADGMTQLKPKLINIAAPNAVLPLSVESSWVENSYYLVD